MNFCVGLDSDWQEDAADPVLLLGNEPLMLQCFLTWLCGSQRLLRQNNPNTWTHQLTAQRLPRGMYAALELLWIAQASCNPQRKLPLTVFTRWVLPTPLLKNKVCRRVRACLGILAMSVCWGQLLNYQWNYLVIYLAYSRNTAGHTVNSWIANVEKKKPTRTAPVTVRDVVCAWFTRVWLF